MKDFNETRPEFITCDNLWQLYLSLRAKENPYFKVRLEDDDKKYLYVIENMTFDIDEEARYTFDDMANMRLPYEKNEYLVLHLRRMICDEEVSRVLRIAVNTYVCYQIELTAAELLERCGLSFPDEAELEQTHFEKDVPVTYVEKKPKHKDGCPGKSWRLTVQDRASSFRRFLDYSDICFVMDSDCGAPRITMTIPLPDCAVGCIESSIWFYKCEAEVRTYYPDTVSELCRTSEHEGEMLRLLNYFNARVFPDQTDGGAGANTPQIYLAPRFYITEDSSCDITATTIVNYKVWDHVSEIYDYITRYCPQVMSDLAPYVVCVLTGAVPAEEAICRIQTELINVD